MAGPSTWAPGQIAQLRRLWPTSAPASEIGREIGVSKNSVVSKAHRLGLPGRLGPQNIAKARQKRREGEAAKVPDHSGCRFIASDDWHDRMKRGEQIYCGAPVHAPGSAWCEHHHSIVYIPDSAAPAPAIERIVQWRARA